MNVVVVGMGYVGLSIATMLAKDSHVTVVDVDPGKVALLEDGVSPIKDDGITAWLEAGGLDLVPTLDAKTAYSTADLIVVAVPTDFDPDKGELDTSLVDSVLAAAASARPEATIVIKSTIPMGYTDGVRESHPDACIVFSPEFLREGHALEDCLHPSRIIVGVPRADVDNEDVMRRAGEFASLMERGSHEDAVPVILMPAAEAESVKLFSNTYLAMRVAFFNELDSFALHHGLDVESIISGVSLDPRIGTHYNNPSFGYGGYCLPKDTKELLSLYEGVPQDLMGAIVSSNDTRLSFVVEEALRRARALASDNDDARPTIGVYGLVMKQGSDNYRSSATIEVMRRLDEAGATVLVYEPSLKEGHFLGAEVVNDLGEFKRRSTLILANRLSEELSDSADKVFSRDVYGRG